MPIKLIELFHGAVLARLMRRDRPVGLKLLEFNADEASAAYMINDEVIVYIKHSRSPRERERKNYRAAWIFHFRPEHLKEISQLGREKDVYIILACGDKHLENWKSMFVCMLEPEQVVRCIQLGAFKNQQVTVANPTRGKLRVWGTDGAAARANPLLVEKGALEAWEIPGS